MRLMTLQAHVLRMKPGDDLRGALEAAFRELQAGGVQAACVVSAVGSLSRAVLRYADQPGGTKWAVPLELLTLSGTLSGTVCTCMRAWPTAKASFAGAM
jgi:predicted DNA-binding protein with PD1-like motif